jgi:hypothetical protein
LFCLGTYNKVANKTNVNDNLAKKKKKGKGYKEI